MSTNEPPTSLLIANWLFEYSLKAGYQELHAALEQAFPDLAPNFPKKQILLAYFNCLKFFAEPYRKTRLNATKMRLLNARKKLVDHCAETFASFEDILKIRTNKALYKSAFIQTDREKHIKDVSAILSVTLNFLRERIPKSTAIDKLHIGVSDLSNDEMIQSVMSICQKDVSEKSLLHVMAMIQSGCPYQQPDETITIDTDVDECDSIEQEPMDDSTSNKSTEVLPLLEKQDLVPEENYINMKSQIYNIDFSKPLTTKEQDDLKAIVVNLSKLQEFFHFETLTDAKALLGRIWEETRDLEKLYAQICISRKLFNTCKNNGIIQKKHEDVDSSSESLYQIRDELSDKRSGGSQSRKSTVSKNDSIQDDKSTCEPNSSDSDLHGDDVNGIDVQNQFQHEVNLVDALKTVNSADVGCVDIVNMELLDNVDQQMKVIHNEISGSKESDDVPCSVRSNDKELESDSVESKKATSGTLKSRKRALRAKQRDPQQFIATVIDLRDSSNDEDETVKNRQILSNGGPTVNLDNSCTDSESDDEKIEKKMGVQSNDVSTVKKNEVPKVVSKEGCDISTSSSSLALREKITSKKTDLKNSRFSRILQVSDSDSTDIEEFAIPVLTTRTFTTATTANRISSPTHDKQPDLEDNDKTPEKMLNTPSTVHVSSTTVNMSSSTVYVKTPTRAPKPFNLKTVSDSETDSDDVYESARSTSTKISGKTRETKKTPTECTTVISESDIEYMSVDSQSFITPNKIPPVASKTQSSNESTKEKQKSPKRDLKIKFSKKGKSATQKNIQMYFQKSPKGRHSDVSKSINAEQESTEKVQKVTTPNNNLSLKTTQKSSPDKWALLSRKELDVDNSTAAEKPEEEKTEQGGSSPNKRTESTAIDNYDSDITEIVPVVMVEGSNSNESNSATSNADLLEVCPDEVIIGSSVNASEESYQSRKRSSSNEDENTPKKLKAGQVLLMEKTALTRGCCVVLERIVEDDKVTED